MTRPIPAPTLIGQPPLASSSFIPSVNRIPYRKSIKPIPPTPSVIPIQQKQTRKPRRKRFQNILPCTPAKPKTPDRPHFNEKGQYIHPEFLPPDSPVFLKVSKTSFGGNENRGDLMVFACRLDSTCEVPFSFVFFVSFHIYADS